MMSSARDGAGEARLLVVDDEETILELLSGSLRFAGFEVMTAASGAEALRAASVSRPDLVLLDVMMPDGDGFDVLRMMRSSGADVPVIFLTARDAVGERVAGLELDDDSHEVRRDGTLIALTPTEFRLLRFLMRNAGRVLSRGQILDHVWDHNPAGDGNVVEPCVSYLRRKVDQGEPRLIHTIRGIGYVLRIPPP